MADASAISATMQEQFEGFSYVGNEIGKLFLLSLPLFSLGSMSQSVIDKMGKINVAGSVTSH